MNKQTVIDQTPDIFGTPVKKGDFIINATRNSTNPIMTIGRVLNVMHVDPEYGREHVVLKVVEAYQSWRRDFKKIKVTLCAGHWIKITPESVPANIMELIKEG